LCTSDIICIEGNYTNKTKTKNFLVDLALHELAILWVLYFVLFQKINYPYTSHKSSWFEQISDLTQKLIPYFMPLELVHVSNT